MAIRKASRKYNSDFMSRYCDEQLEQLEDRLTALYANANNDVLAEYAIWSKSYEKNYTRMVEKLDAGEITKEEFKEWCDKRLFDEQLYKKTIASMTDILVNTDVAAMALVNNECKLSVISNNKSLYLIQRNKLKKLVKAIESRQVGKINAQQLDNAVKAIDKLNRKKRNK